MSNNNLTYRRVGDYFIPNLILPPEERNITLGKWGMMHKDYLLKHKPVIVGVMTVEGRFWQYLADIDKQTTEIFDSLVEQMKAIEGVTEKLKAEDQMLWVQRLMNIEARAREIVCKELIYV